MRAFRLFAVLAALAAAAFADEPVSTRAEFYSQPSRAQVLVDGRDRGVTPLTLFDLTPGRHCVKCRHDGYVDYVDVLNLEAGRPVQCNAVLAAEKGILLLKSEPAGCNIQINGISVGETPRLITDLDAKDVHKVTLRKAGYRPSTFEIRFAGRKPLLRTETLVLDSGTINVTSEPAGAAVTVNGIDRGKTPVRVTDVPKGVATVKLHLDGYRDEVRELTMRAGDTQMLALHLNGLPGTLTLTSVPEGARFYVNGEFAGKSPVTVANLKPGDYQVKAELDGYGTLGRTVKIGNGAAPKEEFRLSNVMGRIEVRTEPPAAQVLLDGRVLGATKAGGPDATRSNAFPIENVMEGEHVLVIRREGYAERTLHPKVTSQKTTKVNVQLKRIFRPDVEIVTTTGTYRGVLVKNSTDYVIVEVKLGVQRSFQRADIRKINFIPPEDASPKAAPRK